MCAKLRKPALNDNFSKDFKEQVYLCDSEAGILRRCLDCSAIAKVCESCAVSQQMRYFSSSGNPVGLSWSLI